MMEWIQSVFAVLKTIEISEDELIREYGATADAVLSASETGA